MNAPGTDNSQRPRPTSSGNETLISTGGIYSKLLYGSESRRELNRPRLIALILLIWAPLLVLSAVGGKLMPGKVDVPFIYDLEAHARLLLALPLLIVAEIVAIGRLNSLLPQFLRRDLIHIDAKKEFDSALDSTIRIRNSGVAEALLLLAVFAIGILFLWRHYVVPQASTWYLSSSAEAAELSLAGYWYALVALPTFQFVLLRWYFHLFLWGRFLWKVSRLNLDLIPTHPDRVGGLGFLSEATLAFVVFAFAHGWLLAGWLATRILVLGAPLTDFKIEVGAITIFVLFLTHAPLSVFATQLRRTKRHGLIEYGELATRYVRGFDNKWLNRENSEGDQLVGSPDLQSLADLGNSFELVEKMQKVPITRDGVLRIVIATIVPVAPLLLTLIPADELMQKLIGVLI